VRTLCEEKTQYHLSHKERAVLEEEVNLERVHSFLVEEKIIKKGTDWADIPFYKPKPTQDCPSGYEGRIGIHETLVVSEAIKPLIIQNATSDALEDQAKKEHMMTMLEDGVVKAVQGVTSLAEVLRVTRE